MSIKAVREALVASLTCSPPVSLNTSQDSTVPMHRSSPAAATSGQLASARKLPVDEVRADLIAGLNPGVKLVPSHVMAMGLVQERGVTYVKL